jgi:glutathione S-transferase
LRAFDGRCVEGAVTLWREYFWPHGRSALRLVGLTDKHANARSVLRWLSLSHRAEVGREEVRRGALAQRLDAGERMTLADISVGYPLNNMGKPDFASLLGPRATAYRERLLARPAFQRAAAVP